MMLTAKEMHIQVELGLSQLGAGIRRKIHPQQIDWALNKAQNEFVQAQVNPRLNPDGFEYDQIDVDKVRTLLRTKVLVTPEYLGQYRGNNHYVVTLPWEYAYHVADSWLVAKDCASTKKKLTTYQYDSGVLVFDTTAVSPTAPYYNTVNIQVFQPEMVQLQLPVDMPDYAGFPSQDQVFDLVALVLESYSEKNRNKIAKFVPVWEQLGEHTQPNAIFFDRQNYGSDNDTPVFATFDGIGATSGVFTQVPQVHSFGSKAPTKTIISRQARTSGLEQMLDAPFYRPSENSFLSTIETNQFHLYTPPSVIVSIGWLTYIRKPRRINVGLDRNCELPGDFQGYIADRAVEWLSGINEANNLLQVTQDHNTKNKP